MKNRSGTYRKTRKTLPLAASPEGPLAREAVSQCHSEAVAEACPEQSEGTHEILHFVQNDKHAISLIVTQPPRGEGI
jgi:hypothetical protein